MCPVVVFDTNILISGIIWRDPPYRCLEFARAGQVEAVTCQEILDELEEKLKARFGYSADRATEAINDVLIFARLVTIANKLKIIAADPDDDKVLECAVEGQATHIVSGDRHLLSLDNFKGNAVVSAVDFLKQIPLSPNFRSP